MIYRAYINQGTDDFSDFESNYKDSAVQVNQIVFGSTTDFIKKVTYSAFKEYIDGEQIKWGDVRYIVYPEFYELWLVV